MIILGLGSNVGDRLHHLSRAVDALGKSVLAAIEISPIYESNAVLNRNSPEDWNQPFLNMAVVGETHLSPEDLLKTIKMMEKSLGRQERGVWAPREIDIDILVYGSNVIKTDNLIIPHKDLCNRPFALLPLADIAPNWQYPIEGAFMGKTAYEISHQLFEGTSSTRKTNYTILAESEIIT